jgi:hypothetical protein
MREDGRIEIAGLILDPQDFELRLRTMEKRVRGILTKHIGFALGRCGPDCAR